MSNNGQNLVPVVPPSPPPPSLPLPPTSPHRGARQASPKTPKLQTYPSSIPPPSSKGQEMHPDKLSVVQSQPASSSHEVSYVSYIV